MFQITLRTGTPYSIDCNEFIPLPSNIRLKGGVKKALTNNYSAMDTEDFKELMFDVVTMSDEPIGDERLQGLFADALKKDLGTIIDGVKHSNNSKAINNIAHFFNVSYHHELNTFGHQHPKHPVSIRLMDIKVGYTKKELSSFGLDVNVEATGGILKKLKKRLNKEQKQIFDEICLFVRQDQDQDNSDIFQAGSFMFEVTLMMCILNMADDAKVNGAVRAIWSCCDTLGIYSAFLLFYGYFQKTITVKRFPFLFHQSIKWAYDSLIKNKEDVLEFTEELVAKNEDIKVIEAIVDILEDEDIDCLKTIHNIKSCCDIYTGIELIETYKEHHKQIKTKVNGLNENIKSLPFECPKLTIANNSNKLRKKDFKHAYYKVSDIEDVLTEEKVLEINREWESLSSTKITALNKEAEKLGKDALNNLQRLGEIKVELQHIDVSIKNERQILTTQTINSLAVLQSTLDEYILKVVDTDKAPNSPEQELEEHVELLESELESVKSNFDTIKGELKNTKAELQLINSQPKIIDSPKQSSSVSLDDIRPLLTTGENIGDILQLLIKMSGDHIVLGDNCLKELASSNFGRTGVFFDKLSVLLSKDFINTFTNKGSLACFNYFTKTELAFKESKSTLNNKECSRTFKFNKKPVDCTYHLRFGVNSTEQHMLRVYFTIENNQLFIGSITKHLETSSVK